MKIHRRVKLALPQTTKFTPFQEPKTESWQWSRISFQEREEERSLIKVQRQHEGAERRGCQWRTKLYVIIRWAMITTLTRSSSLTKKSIKDRSKLFIRLLVATTLSWEAWTTRPPSTVDGGMDPRDTGVTPVELIYTQKKKKTPLIVSELSSEWFFVGKQSLDKFINDTTIFIHLRKHPRLSERGQFRVPLGYRQFNHGVPGTSICDRVGCQRWKSTVSPGGCDVVVEDDWARTVDRLIIATS